MDISDKSFELMFDRLKHKNHEAAIGLIIASRHQDGVVDDQTVLAIQSAFFRGYDSFIYEVDGSFKVAPFMQEYLLKTYDVEPDGSYQTKQASSDENVPLPIGELPGLNKFKR